jgi:co-chaperonin GroES (HSP10)
MALKDTLIEQGPAGISPFAAGDYVGFGVALIRSAARVCKGTMADNADAIIGFSVQPQNGVVLDQDGIYQATNDAGVPDVVRVARKGAVINALVIAKANTSIVDGDYLEAAPLGDASCYIGVLNEAGTNAGETRVDTALAQALEDCTITNASYKQPTGNVAVGASTITLSSGDMTLLDLKEGDYVLLEDVNGDAQLNRVKSKTATVITLQIPSTVALTANTDYVYKVFQVKAVIL